MNSETKLKEKLISKLNLSNVDVINNSHLHSGHISSPNNGNSHFKVIIKDIEFSKLPKIKSHQLIYKILQEEMSSFIHALEIEIST